MSGETRLLPSGDPGWPQGAFREGPSSEAGEAADFELIEWRLAQTRMPHGCQVAGPNSPRTTSGVRGVRDTIYLRFLAARTFEPILVGTPRLPSVYRELTFMRRAIGRG